MMHIGLTKDDVGRYAFIPGSPERTAKIAKYFDNPEELVFNREFRTFVGTLDGVKVVVTSTGIGGPSTAIAVEELSKIGVDTMIRIGTCAAMSGKVSKGDIIVPSGAVRMEGTSTHYLPMEFPAVPNFSLMRVLCETTETLGLTYHTDVSITKASFHSQTEPEAKPVARDLTRKWEEYIRGGATSTSMECSVVFAVGSALGIRTASILVSATDGEDLGGNGQGKEQKLGDSYDLEDRVIKAGVEAMRQVIKQDQANK